MKAEETQERDDGGPAFPVPCSAGPLGAITWGEGGMTLRDYFAAKAMQGLIAQNAVFTAKHIPEGVLTLPARVAVPPIAYEYADAMLAARKK